MTFCCPVCHGDLSASVNTLVCGGCSAIYPRADGIADFSDGHYYDHFESEEELSDEQRRGLAAEVSGSRWRIERFYAPRIAAGARVLDCGCGNGVSVDVMRELGFDAWGIDLSALRKWQWRERIHRDRLAVASALRLPFGNETFDVVISSGVIEHIGVEEERGETYRVRPSANRDEQRRQFVGELLRVTRSGGRVFVDCPNGAFPIDFWHGTVGGNARFHRGDEGFLPTFGDIVRYAGGIEVVARSPHRRFAFRQVGRHWYGKLLALPVSLLFAVAGGTFAKTRLNPYLIVEMKKPPTGGFAKS